jgi:uncharacterized protein (DUF1778 family)
MRKIPRAAKAQKSKKHRVNVYFETKAQIGLVLRAAKKEQGLLRPNLSRYMVETALQRANKTLAEEEPPRSLENLSS